MIIKKNKILLILFISVLLITCSKTSKFQSVNKLPSETVFNFNELTEKEYNVLINKGTEIPFTGDLLNIKDEGVYICRICTTPLFKSEDKFNSGTGWPSFDDAFTENIKLLKDGERIEVVCAKCNGHMGHVFYGEGFTDKETRYCINSVSLIFVHKFTNENNINK